MTPQQMREAANRIAQIWPYAQILTAEDFTLLIYVDGKAIAGIDILNGEIMEFEK